MSDSPPQPPEDDDPLTRPAHDDLLAAARAVVREYEGLRIRYEKLRKKCKHLEDALVTARAAEATARQFAKAAEKGQATLQRYAEELEEKLRDANRKR